MKLARFETPNSQHHMCKNAGFKYKNMRFCIQMTHIRWIHWAAEMGDSKSERAISLVSNLIFWK
ncbi:MAG: hypothetical protein ABJH63_20980 [Rhizobiaceae bacterium]